jgi:hypothetical protein
MPQITARLNDPALRVLYEKYESLTKIAEDLADDPRVDECDWYAADKEAEAARAAYAAALKAVFAA